MNAIDCFKRQTWPVKSLTIANASEHTIDTSDDHLISVITGQAAMSLGELKNAAIEATIGQWYFVWCTDHWYDPSFIHIAMEFTEGADLVYTQLQGQPVFGVSRKAMDGKKFNYDGSDADFYSLFTKTRRVRATRTLVRLLDRRFDVEAARAKTAADRLDMRPADARYPRVPGTRADYSHGTCVVCLGRYGDIMNALPIARMIYKASGNAPAFLAAENFSDILDGVGYVVPHVYKGRYSNLEDARAATRGRFSNVVTAQIYNAPESDPTLDEPYNRQAWDLAGYLDKWDDAEAVLEFDRRDPVRERALIRKHVRKDAKPILLLMLTGGLSSRYSHAGELQQRIRDEFEPKFQVIDLAAIKAPRIYDLLGLYEVASALITIDSATLHLACAAMQLPVCALVPDNNYLATRPRCSCELSFSYSETLAQYAHIAEWLSTKSKVPKIWHAYEDHAGLLPRELRAISTWNALWHGFNWMPVAFGEPYPRSSRSIGDKRGVPYLNDVLSNALKRADPQDIVVLTNSDTILLPEIHREILEQLSVFPAMCSSRRDIADFSEVKTMSPSGEHCHPGRDIFAFRAWWLRRQLTLIPDMLLGTAEWDNLLVNLIRKEAGVLVSGIWDLKSSRTVTDVEIASGNVLHEVHEAYHVKTALSGPHNVKNILELADWARIYCPSVEFTYADTVREKYRKGHLRLMAT